MLAFIPFVACTIEETPVTGGRVDAEPAKAEVGRAKAEMGRGSALPGPTDVELEGITVCMFDSRGASAKGGKQHCEWLRVDQRQKVRRLASFPGPCGNEAQISWYEGDPDHAMVKLDDGYWDVRDGKVTALPGAPAGDEGFGLRTEAMHPGVHGLVAEPAGPLASELASFLEDGAPTGEWQIATTDQGRVAWLQTPQGPALPILRETPDGWRSVAPGSVKAPPGLTLMWRSPFLLVTLRGSRPRIIDLATGQVVYTSNDAVGVVFWPGPTEGHPEP